MNLRVLIFLVIGLLVLSACSPKQPLRHKITTTSSAKNPSIADTIFLSIEPADEQHSVSFYHDDEVLQTPYIIASKTGEQTVKAIIEKADGNTEILKTIRVFAPNKPKVFGYELIQSYPHDINSYTQGLEFVNGTLFESTGQYGNSSLRKVNFKTGEVIQKLPIDKAYFAEGITHFNGKIIQLTWKKKVGFVYNSDDLTLDKSFSYTKSPEGWGLCSDGNFLYKTDGSQKLWKLDPYTFEELYSQDIVTHNTYISKVNELEFVNGKIYANTYQYNKDVVVIFDPNTGIVSGVVDFSGLKKQVTQHNKLDVFNGIAYHPERKTFFVTGKYWDKLFEVKIIEK
ncbi:MAG: glutamine cyclotransferase [Flavobacteriaceae bacterium]|nr:glutamine cyclotransferase [Flavobacteriaceae bacterium]|tara:strand:+ start:96 stop:1118 length:1023 start_codon:yes stop_codon:yes gene_type:complete